MKKAIGFLVVMGLHVSCMGTYKLNEVGQPGMCIQATYKCTISV